METNSNKKLEITVDGTTYLRQPIKTCLIENIRSRFKDGMTVMVGGFGVPGTPFTLIDALLAAGASDLTLIKNEANEDHMGLSKLIEAGSRVTNSPATGTYTASFSKTCSTPTARSTNCPTAMPAASR